VLGHVDAVTRLRNVREHGSSWTYRFAIPKGLARFVVEKGSVALDGISLTVARRRARDFDVAVIRRRGAARRSDSPGRETPSTSKRTSSRDSGAPDRWHSFPGGAVDDRL
jgi:hypothetical protein